MSDPRLSPIDHLVQALKRLPGIGEKTALRLAYFLLAAPESVASELGDAVSRLREEVVLCTECFNLSDESLCAICRDEARPRTEICVVEEPSDLAVIESSGAYRGRYHVLGGRLSPLDGTGPDVLRIAPLVERVRRDGVREIVLAMNPTPEGEATALFLADQLEPLGVSVTRIACGMPIGGNLEYTDSVTVRKSLENRRQFRT